MSTAEFRELALFETPLQGLSLIEASAGTGKTWTITGLYVRLILELGLTVEQILVVTYTKAATAELRERIRSRLSGMLAALETGASEDAFCREKLDRLDGHRELAARRLTLALRSFDEAAIFTIHGFCQRVLTESAFESGMAFESELTPDETEIIRETVDDFWRRETAGASGLWVKFLVEKGQTPDAWRESIRVHVDKPFLALAPLPPLPDSAAIEEELRAAYRSARTHWLGERNVIGELLLAGGLNQTSYKREKLPQWFAELDRYFAPDEPQPATPEFLAKLTPDALAKGTKKNAAAPIHAFFDSCRRLCAAGAHLHEHFALRLIDIKRRLLQDCNAELPRRKTQRGLLSYGDLLNRLAAALQAEHGAHLANIVRERYRAALIDEFQDTDPVQYDIFRTIYSGSGSPAFFVGDPKQAIYGFRGADVYSYLKAREAAQARFTLATNQRSTPGLIAAVNALFARSPNPFLFESIEYLPVRAADKERPELVMPGESDQPFRFFLIPDQGSPWPKVDGNQLAAQATATEITRLLNLATQGKARLAGAGLERALSGGDIAVLVPSHRQGRLIQDALMGHGVPSVRQGQDNVFASAEAAELERILLAIAAPQREARITSALTTELIGMDGAGIFALKSAESAWERLLEDYARYRELWQGHGFMPMFRCWFEENRIAERLLGYRDGERRLTNLLHLAERLQVKSRDEPGLDSLLGWFSRALRDPDSGDEESLLRLESDAERVKIITIHTSKGLEYPVVFCPFLWDGRLWQKYEADACFHDPSQNYRPVLNLGGPDFEVHRALASREKLAEKLRLLYVALTRAVHRCYVVWGHIKEMENSALAWLLHGPTQATDDPLAGMQSIFKGMSYAEIETAVREFAERSPANVAFESLTIDTERYAPPRKVGKPLQALSFRRGSLRPSWRMSSFSALAGGRHSEAPDYDAPAEPHAETTADESIFAFPRGATAGRCLHAIFEEWDFESNDEAALHRLIQRKLKAHAIAESWTPTVAGMVKTTLNAPLDEGGLRLARIGKGRRLVELEFTYPLRTLELPGLRRILSDPVLGLPEPFAQASCTLGFETVRGYMKGFIDLTFEADGRFYLVDYKSNWLGNRPEDYASPRLIQAMAREHYYLQYLIYCLALHRYLRLRLPDYDYERHFGGVFYLFLRGIAPRTGTGIFSDRPGTRLIEALDRLVSQGAPLPPPKRQSAEG
jgi:exodeoxyribonuclease V beta subunit